MCYYTNHMVIQLKGGVVEEGGGLAMYAANIHLRPMEVSDEQGVLYLHGTLGAGKSRWGAGVETSSGVDL